MLPSPPSGRGAYGTRKNTETVMTRFLILFSSTLFIASLFFPFAVFPQKADSIIQDFKVQALYRAAKLTWKVKEGVKGGGSVQILRADSFEDAPYKELEAVPISPGKTNYDYVALCFSNNDTSLGTITLHVLCQHYS